MFDRIKRFFLQFIIVVINAALVIGGVLFIKNQQQKKQDQQDLVLNVDINNAQQAVADQARQLQQIVDQNRNQKKDDIADNPGTVTVQKPVTVTQTIPAKTKTVQVPASSSTSSKTKAS